MKRPIPYGRQSIDDDDVAAVVNQLRSDWLTQGPTIAEFEQALASATGARFCVAVSSGTAALHLACLAAGLSPGDSALVPDITFVATANAVRYVGARPVLVDVNPATALVDVDLLEDACQRQAPKAILPVSFAGAIPDLPRIRAIANRAGACVIEDAAHSVGATYAADGTTVRSGSCVHTDMATLSFHPVKHVTTGEGGAVLTNDEKRYQQLCMLRTHGITKDPQRLTTNDGPWYYEQQCLGFNYRITDIQCALGVSQTRKLAAFVERRRDIAGRYDDALAQDERVAPLEVPSDVASSYHLYVLRLTLRRDETLVQLAERRKAFYTYLREHGVLPQVHYIPVHRQPDYIAQGLADGSFSGADTYYAGCISLPMFPALTDGEVNDVIASVRAALDAC